MDKIRRERENLEEEKTSKERENQGTSRPKEEEPRKRKREPEDNLNCPKEKNVVNSVKGNKRERNSNKGKNNITRYVTFQKPKR